MGHRRRDLAAQLGRAPVHVAGAAGSVQQRQHRKRLPLRVQLWDARNRGSRVLGLGSAWRVARSETCSLVFAGLHKITWRVA
eukprot:156346-Chlamydomonas_euryale.AAC.11